MDIDFSGLQEWAQTTVRGVVDALLVWLAALAKQYVGHYVQANQLTIIAAVLSLLLASGVDLMRWQLLDAATAIGRSALKVLLVGARFAFLLFVAYRLYPWIASALDVVLAAQRS